MIFFCQVPSHRSLMVENGVLDVIFREIKNRFHSLRIKREIGLLLGNLALEESAHESMVEQGNPSRCMCSKKLPVSTTAVVIRFQNKAFSHACQNEFALLYFVLSYSVCVLGWVPTDAYLRCRTENLFSVNMVFFFLRVLTTFTFLAEFWCEYSFKILFSKMIGWPISDSFLVK